MLRQVNFDMFIHQVDEFLSARAAGPIREAEESLQQALSLATTPEQERIVEQRRERTERALEALEE
ncbi:MAG: hypothetical protein JRI97_04805 [Deltaproteobacteria bacterium]|nr:hypothetical protein [Deltaproteobacteria bacterium]